MAKKKREPYMYSLEHAWTPFGRRQYEVPTLPYGSEINYGVRPDRLRSMTTTTQRVISPITTQLAIDAAEVEIRHVRLDGEGRYKEDITSKFNNCLTISPNLDQSPTQFRQDVVHTMLDEGVVAIVPVQTTLDPENTGGYDIEELRAGIIVTWLPEHVRVSLYNARTGVREEVILKKSMVAIVENPLYEIMNAPNSTLQRLIKKLAQLDVTDDRVTSGKLDIILQLPYTIKHDIRRREAERRRTDLEQQLSGSQYGIGYTDGAERITQLNRPSENNLLAQVTNLETRLYAQLGLTEEVFFGTADEAAMLNYYNRTVFPIVKAVQEEMHRKFTTSTGKTQGQAVRFFKDPFTLVPVQQLAEIADKFLRNEIMSPNEFRQVVGLRPVSNPEANELRNRNMPKVPDGEPEQKEEKTANESNSPPEDDEVLERTKPDEA